MRSGCFDVKSLAATGICLALAMPIGAAAQQSSGVRFQNPLTTPTKPSSLAPLPPAKPYTLNGNVVADTIVRVNDAVITRNDLLKAQQQLLGDVQAGRVNAAEMPSRSRDMLRDMIDEKLLLSRGKELEINVDSEVTRALDDIRKQNHLDSMEDLQRAVAAEGNSYEDLKAQYRNHIITQQVIRDEVARRMQPPSAEDQQTYYNAHKSGFMQPEQIGLSEILVPAAADATDAQIAQARQRAEAIVAELKGGANFEDASKKNSGGQTAAQGGELGVFKVGTGALNKVFEDQTVSLPVGGVTAPIRTRQGYVILKVTQHVPAGPQAFKDVQPEVMDALFQELMAPAFRNYLTKLRDNAYIDLAPGFVDSGKSPNESKSIFAAATPPPAPKVKAPKKADPRFAAHNSAATTKGSIPALPPASADGTSATASSDKPGKKPKKIKREKVRFGQAPRNALDPGTTEVAEEPTGNAAPGPASSPQADVAVVAAVTEPDVNPMAPQAPPLQKTRFAKSEPVHGPKAPKKVTAKDREHALAQPMASTTEEKQEQQLQSEAHGLSGDNSKKPKKPKKVKGQPAPPKERIQERQPPPPPQQPAPTVNPNLGKPISGQTSDSNSGTQTSAPTAK